MGFCKKLINSIIFLILIVVCMLLISTKSECASLAFSVGPNAVGNYGTINCYMPDSFLDKFYNTSVYNDNYYYVIYLNGSTYRIIAVDKTDYPSFQAMYWTSNGNIYFTCDTTFYYYYWQGGLNDTINLARSDTAVSAHYTIASGNYPSNFSTNTTNLDKRPVYSDNNGVYLWSNYSTLQMSWGGNLTRATFPDEDYPDPFVAPRLFPPASDSQTYLDQLTSGEFTYFWVDPGSLTEDDTILLNFYDVTYNDAENTIAQQWVLNKDSSVFDYTNIEHTEFNYLLPARFLNWFKVVNGRKYRANLSWVNPNTGLTENTVYNWTMSLTTAQQETEEQTTQQEINAGIQDLNNNINDLNNTQQEINNFLTDDTYNNSIFQLPSVEINSNFITYGDSLYSMIEEVFTDTTGDDFVFQIPFSNGSITIPANYIETHLPSVIVNLIRIFYWYIICRFILKDILHTIDKLRQGDWFLTSENDIKTEVL